MYNNNSNSIHQLNYLCAESTATRPITDTAQRKYSNTNNNSIQFIYVQNVTAQRPITKLAQA
jgi:hypothetical protein